MKQPQTEFCLHVSEKRKQKNTFLVSVLDLSRPAPDTGSLLLQHKPKINSEDRETTLGVGRTLLLGRHTQEGCSCHTSAHKTINWPGLCAERGPSVHGRVGVWTLGTAVFSRPLSRPHLLAISHAKMCECIVRAGGGGGLHASISLHPAGELTSG